MTKEITIRPANHDDNKAIRSLLKQLGYDLTSEQITEKIDYYHTAKAHYAFVADMDGKAVGFMTIHIIEWFHRPDFAARLSAIVIDEKSRGGGIGRALMDKAENIARESGCVFIELTSSLQRKEDGTHDFYHSIGYEPVDSSLYFRKKLS